MVTVIFIDLVGSSRSPGRRAELQRVLLGARDRLNAGLGDRLAAPFDVVWGDELKGVLQDPRPVWELYQFTYRLMAGIPFYFSVGLGSIDTAIGYEPGGNIDLLDGTAFKAAREAMDRLKAGDIKPYRICFGSAGSTYLAEALNAYVAVLNDLVRHMTAAQRRHFLKEFPWHGAEEAGEGESVSRQSVWETLQRARIDAYRAAQRGIAALLQLAAEHPALVLPAEKDGGRP